ncbi:thiamine phosphate synthase [Pedobacter sp. MW01-1-1]|uniref:thiamine phosphate synthase n=1 Tax=Pedobacter sp. MW01-1-1 TaxID=3383027 RepID=UPI003FF095D1
MIDKLHYISQEPENGTHLSAIQAALDAGVRWIQLRIKNQPEETIFNTALAAAQLCKTYQAKLIINDYPEIALNVGAYGVHLGLEDMPIENARAIVGKNTIIGGTANTLDQVLQRIQEGVDYIGLGPYRYTKTKEKLSPILGLTGYQNIMEQLQQSEIKTPIIAIGGIVSSDIAELLKTGLHGVAVSGAITYAPDALTTVKNLYQQLNNPHLIEI